MVIYDIQQTNRRYMSQGDLHMELQLLGLPLDSTPLQIGEELHRRGLDNFSPGRAVKGAKA